MPRPSALPEWATDPTYTSGPQEGEATRLAPTSGEMAQGFFQGKRPPARKANWLLGLLCDWVKYLSEGSARYGSGSSVAQSPIEWQNVAVGGEEFSVDSDTAVEVPTAGRYLVAWSGNVVSSSSGDAISIGLALQVGGVTVGVAAARRFTTASNSVRVANTTLVEISTPASQRLTVLLTAEAGTPSLTGGTDAASLSIVRVS